MLLYTCVTIGMNEAGEGRRRTRKKERRREGRGGEQCLYQYTVVPK